MRRAAFTYGHRIGQGANEDGSYSFVAVTNKKNRNRAMVVINGIDTKNFEANPVVLFGHNDYSLEAVIGRVVNLNKTDQRMAVDIKFSETDEGQRAQQKVDEGTLSALSIGFWADWDAVEVIEDGEGFVRLFAKTELAEISLVAIPADPGAVKQSFAFSSEALSLDALASEAEEDMAEKKTTQKPDEKVEVEKKVELAVVPDVKADDELQRQRVKAYTSEVTQLCRLAGKPELAIDFISEVVEIAAVRAKLVELRAKEDEEEGDIDATRQSGGASEDNAGERTTQAVNKLSKVGDVYGGWTKRMGR